MSTIAPALYCIAQRQLELCMDSQLVERVQAVIVELSAIRAELGTAATDPATRLAIPKLATEQANAFKREIDQTRIFLWAYMDSWSAGVADPKNRLAQIRMEAVSDMLAQLQQDFRITGLPPSSEGRRLSAQIRAVAPLLPD